MHAQASLEVLDQAAASRRGRSSSNAQPAAAALSSQLRIRDPSTGRVCVQFDGHDAAKQALDIARFVANVAIVSHPSGWRDLPSSSSSSNSVYGEAWQRNGVLDRRPKSAFAGGWLVDLLHAAVYRNIAAAAATFE